ncbi:MAG: hypothetical protein ABR875_02660 [Minisyncoccia bacterium]
MSNLVIRSFRWIFNFKDEKKRLLNVILVSFLIFFVGARLYSLYVTRVIYIHGFHIHHFFYGMLFLSVGGVLGVLSRDKRPLEVASIFIGAGIGLFADEIGLLLNCTTLNRLCVYAFPDTFDIFMLVVGVIILAIIITGLIENYYASKAENR